MIKSTFASSLGYYNEDGMIKGTGFKRFSGSFNGSYKIFPILNIKAGVSYVWSTRPELWIGTYEFFYRTVRSVLHGILGWKTELLPQGVALGMVIRLTIVIC